MEYLAIAVLLALPAWAVFAAKSARKKKSGCGCGCDGCDGCGKRK